MGLDVAQAVVKLQLVIDNLSFCLYNTGITSFLKGGHDEMVYNTAQACLTYPAFSASE